MGTKRPGPEAGLVDMGYRWSCVSFWKKGKGVVKGREGTWGLGMTRKEGGLHGYEFFEIVLVGNFTTRHRFA